LGEGEEPQQPGHKTGSRSRLVALMERPQKITLADMRAAGVRGLLIYCSDYHCSHWQRSARMIGRMTVRLSDLEPRFTCQACGRRGRDARLAIG
jgi:hypothetical protein